MSLKHGLLGLLNYCDMTGYDLDKTFRNSLYLGWNATTSQIYRELNTMQTIGWINSKEIVQNGKPNKKIYHITEVGNKELHDWLLKDHISEELSLRHPLFLQIFFAGENHKQDNIKILKKVIDTCKELLNAIDHSEETTEQYKRKVADQNKSEYWSISTMLGKSYYNSLLSWAEEALQLLESEDTDVSK